MMIRIGDPPDHPPERKQIANPKVKVLFGASVAALGVLSIVVHYLGLFETLFDACLALVGIVAAIVVHKQEQRFPLGPAALILGVVIGGGATGYLIDHREWLSTNGPGPPPVWLTVESVSDRKVVINSVRTRAPANGRKFWVMAHIHDVNAHSEFWPSKDLSPQPDRYSYEFTLPGNASPRQRWSVRVYEVDDATGARLQYYRTNKLKPPIPELVQPPCDDCSASNEVDLPFR
ncbi:hypothetical protein [Paractinoplanes lichenicola]|uniref:Uncharacterized protein n=1 Tax=Paractinoplanes lichenicola TaxID=2802976 RepID=A0ABS1VYE7_9ACTN|nr:hypothetical protein [Actinoplanes lichenicola]MBL7259480.1 hypothetical protein [Actinoplanes lichenicola]